MVSYEGRRITFEDGYYFYPTEFGTLVKATCEACEAETYEAEYRTRQTPDERDPLWTLCSRCTRDLYFKVNKK